MQVVYKGDTGLEKDRITIDMHVKNALDVAKDRVLNKNYDYFAVGAGFSGVGKSTFFKNTAAPYCCPWFDLSYIAFTADEFIEICNKAPRNSAVVLDECFESLNSRTGSSKEFLKIFNHLQIIRQKNLFIFLALPNFFDLNKNVALFRVNHLFVCYESPKTQKRGYVLGFGRDTKRALYIRGGKYCDYNAVRANFRAEFRKNKDLYDEEEYDRMKMKHLMDQGKKINAPALAREDKANELMENVIIGCVKLEWKQKFIADLLGVDLKTVSTHWLSMVKRGRVPTYLKEAMRSHKKNPIMCPKAPIN